MAKAFKPVIYRVVQKATEDSFVCRECSNSETFLFSNVMYRIYSRINRPAYEPTPIPAPENVAKISDSCISR